jgi:uncharacterized protein DUF559
MNGQSEVRHSSLAGEDRVRRCRAPGEREAAHLSRLGNARQLRQNMTDAKQALWRILRNRQFSGVKFRRQVSIGPYIADFIRYDARLVIEAGRRSAIAMALERSPLIRPLQGLSRKGRVC